MLWSKAYGRTEMRSKPSLSRGRVECFCTIITIPVLMTTYMKTYNKSNMYLYLIIMFVV